MKMIFKVNNGRRLEVFQDREDDKVYLITRDSHGEEESHEIIQPGDFVMMLNWYRYQKENGNENLNF